MIYPVHHIKYVTIVTLIVSILFFTPGISMAEVSDPIPGEERLKPQSCQSRRVY